MKEACEKCFDMTSILLKSEVLLVRGRVDEGRGRGRGETRGWMWEWWRCCTWVPCVW